MIKWNIVIIGFILAIVFSLIGSRTGVVGSSAGILIASIIVGYMVDVSFMNGAVHGAIIGVLGAIILTIIALIIGQASTLLATYVGLSKLGSIVIATVIGAVGGTIGSLITDKNPYK